MLFKMAWRNLWRSKRRTMLTSISVAFGFWLAASVLGMQEHSYTRMVDVGAMMGSGHVMVQPLGFHREPSLDKRLTHARQTLETIGELSEVRAAVPRVTGQAMFATGRKARGGQFLAFDPVLEGAENNFFLRHIVEGDTFESSREKGVIVGQKLADNLGLKLGKKLMYTTSVSRGEIVSDVARVRAIFRTRVLEVDSGVVLLPIDSARSALGFGPDEFSQIAILTHRQESAADVRDALLASLAPDPNREVLTWSQAQPDLASFIAVDKSMNTLFFLFIGALIAAGILNTVLMSMLERRREFGVMLALGMSPRRLVTMVFVESACMALLGLGLGVVLLVPWYFFMAYHGIDFSGFIPEGYDVNGILLDPIMKIQLTPVLLVQMIVSLFVLTFIASLYPAFKAGKIPPVESIRTV